MFKQVIELWTDGGCRGNGKNSNIGAWGCYMVYKNHSKSICGGKKNTTNNEMELTGCIEGLKAIKNTTANRIPRTSTVLAVRHTGRASFAGALRHTLFQQHSNGRRTTLIKKAIAPPIRNGVNSASALPRNRKTASRFTSAHANTISSTSAQAI